MVDSRKKKFSIKKWINELISPEQWEAPDRDFVGHRDILTRSLARYRFAMPFLRGNVLEVGCARGYGIEKIKSKAHRVFGVDISFPFLLDAQTLLPDVPFIQANGSDLPIKGNSFDVIIAYEVIEHILDDKKFLRVLKMLARNDAVIILSTPNKLIASGNSPKPLDRFHIREYTHTEFRSLLGKVFSQVEIFGQYDRYSSSEIKNSVNRLVDWIPIQLKYLLPSSLQGTISAMIRPQIKIDECKFSTDNLSGAYAFVAICKQ